MSEETTNGAVAPADNTVAFTVEKIYVKDVSFEVPGAPAIFTENVQPDLQLNLNQRVQRLNDNAFEVVLGVTLTCKAGDKTAYVAEVQQAGIFGLMGLTRRRSTCCSVPSARTSCSRMCASWSATWSGRRLPAVLPAADQLRSPVRRNPASARVAARQRRIAGDHGTGGQRLIPWGTIPSGRQSRRWG